MYYVFDSHSRNTLGQGRILGCSYSIPDEVLEAAPKLPCEADTITAILNSPEKSLHSVNGIVSKVSPATTKPVVAESELQELPISSDDDDADRTDEAAPSHMPVGSVIAVFSDPYLACPINSCSNKKLINVLQNELYVMKCSKCNGTFRASTAKTYLRVAVLLNTEKW
ncbi:unnamed protein product [Mytilus coruscus]|uniref:Uncharacterized protein n=1 Tax=Mytilus coruscus TaxID=42192 RepID=A0A6J8E8J4_MYTCO|nr:unnamed protein product [Mytilus coruscus]